VLVVDDEPAIRRFLRAGLASQGYVVTDMDSGLPAVDAARRGAADVIVLDLGLPDIDGMDVISRIRAAGSAVPIIVLSSRDNEAAKVAALDLGADDYVTKPFDTEELLARLRTALRHQVIEAGAPPVVKTGDLEIDLPRRQVRKAGETVHLTRKEYEVLAALASAPGRVVTHQTILERAWPFDHDRRIEYLRIVVRNLRQKIETTPMAPVLIQNELGVGYRLNMEV
jgi:two-component system, OmpR family, KDP operon response regulator KdpE